MNVLREFNFGNLYMRYAADENPDDRDFNMHIHERCEIFYFISGNAEYLVEGARYPLETGSILIMRPAESHRVHILGKGRYERCALNFSVSAVDCIDPERRFLKAFFDRPLGRGNFYALDKIRLENIFDDMNSGNDDYEKNLKIQINLFALLDLINGAFLKKGTADFDEPQSISEQIMAYVNANLFEEISVPTLAEKFFLSPSQFSRIFKQATGAAPWEYITIKRLTAAKEKIRRGVSARQAAESCGFGDYSVFYRAYVKYFGCSPMNDVR
ncbi:MAG: AraC family transcriptional regulator [Ruminococcus sp.]|nr:AraC family transcriptional regulator [Ruminococcus sp.]MCM1380768.1 AraC family transcriptional regulator [Muribaculaceae bacterium]MCM1478449.1 AraC family transcriptional regulator [Muribaculaceae bacterium]